MERRKDRQSLLEDALRIKNDHNEVLGINRLQSFFIHFGDSRIIISVICSAHSRNKIPRVTAVYILKVGQRLRDVSTAMKYSFKPVLLETLFLPRDSH